MNFCRSVYLRTWSKLQFYLKGCVEKSLKFEDFVFNNKLVAMWNYMNEFVGRSKVSGSELEVLIFETYGLVENDQMKDVFKVLPSNNQY